MANPISPAPFPVRNAIVKPDGLPSGALIDWVTNLDTQLQASLTRLITVSASGQQAAITPTNLPTPVLSAGLYRVNVYARITQAATTSSSLTVTIGWLEGTTLSYVFPAMTGNTIATVLTGPPLLVRIDGNSSITYATAYASVGATPMQYRLDVVLERVDA